MAAKRKKKAAKVKAPKAKTPKRKKAKAKARAPKRKKAKAKVRAPKRKKAKAKVKRAQSKSGGSKGKKRATAARPKPKARKAKPKAKTRSKPASSKSRKSKSKGSKKAKRPTARKTKRPAKRKESKRIIESEIFDMSEVKPGELSPKAVRKLREIERVLAKRQGPKKPRATSKEIQDAFKAAEKIQAQIKDLQEKLAKTTEPIRQIERPKLLAKSRWSRSLIKNVLKKRTDPIRMPKDLPGIADLFYYQNDSLRRFAYTLAYPIQHEILSAANADGTVDFDLEIWDFPDDVFEFLMGCEPDFIGAFSGEAAFLTRVLWFRMSCLLERVDGEDMDLESYRLREGLESITTRQNAPLGWAHDIFTAMREIARRVEDKRNHVIVKLIFSLHYSPKGEPPRF